MLANYAQSIYYLVVRYTSLKDQSKLRNLEEIQLDSSEAEGEKNVNLETGRIRWIELQPHFARGSIIAVYPDLDLVEIASAFIKDDSELISKLLNEKKLRKPEVSDAERWYGDNQEFWAVVVAPWVLVQEIVSSCES